MKHIAILLILMVTGCSGQPQPSAQGHRLAVWEAAALSRHHPCESLNRLIRDSTRYFAIATHDKTLQSVVDEFEAVGTYCASKGTSTSDSELTGKSKHYEYSFVVRKDAYDTDDFQFDLICELSAEDSPENPIEFRYSIT